MIRLAATAFEPRPLASFDEFVADVRASLDTAAGADLVVLPELFTLGLISLTEAWQEATAGTELARSARYADDVTTVLADEAHARGQHIVGGSHLRIVDGRLLNVSQTFGPEGLLATHAKTHLFVAEAAAGVQETDELGIVDLPFGRVGLAICYEVQIPELVTALVARGVDIVACPSLTVTEAGFWRVRQCLAARCIENQVFGVHSGTFGAPFGAFPGAWGRGSVLAPCHQPWPVNGVLRFSA